MKFLWKEKDYEGYTDIIMKWKIQLSFNLVLIPSLFCWHCHNTPWWLQLKMAIKKFSTSATGTFPTLPHTQSLIRTVWCAHRHSTVLTEINFSAPSSSAIFFFFVFFCFFCHFHLLMCSFCVFPFLLHLLLLFCVASITMLLSLASVVSLCFCIILALPLPSMFISPWTHNNLRINGDGGGGGAVENDGPKSKWKEIA